MKQAWKNETSSTPVFLRPPPYRARAIPSRGVLRRETRPPAGGNERKLGSSKESERLPTPRAIRQICTTLTLRAAAASTTKTNHPPAIRPRVTLPLQTIAVSTTKTIPPYSIEKTSTFPHPIHTISPNQKNETKGFFPQKSEKNNFF